MRLATLLALGPFELCQVAQWHGIQSAKQMKLLAKTKDRQERAGLDRTACDDSALALRDGRPVWAADPRFMHHSTSATCMHRDLPSAYASWQAPCVPLFFRQMQLEQLFWQPHPRAFACAQMHDKLL